jgi:hypothetical protein
MPVPPEVGAVREPPLHLALVWTLFLAITWCVQVPVFGQVEQTNENRTTPIKVEARLDRNVITIGDKIRYELTVEAPPGVEFRFPEFGENLGVFAIKDFGHAPERTMRGGATVAREWYVLDTHVTGVYIIPPASVACKVPGEEEEHEIAAPQLSVLVESLLEKEGQPVDIRDIKGPVNVPADRRPIYIAAAAGAGALLITGLAVLLVRRRRRIQMEPVEMPWEIALRELGALRSFDPLKEGRIEEFYVTLSAIIRHYLENRFGLRAPEMTTEEFFELMSRDGTLVTAHKQLVRQFLSHCDLVKFARYGPSGDEVHGAYDSAVRLVQETIPQEADEHGESGQETP